MPPLQQQGQTAAIYAGSRAAALKTSQTHKYWNYRHHLFTRFNDGIILDEEGWYSVTPEAIAEHIARRCTGAVVIDAFCGCGGNSIQFARHGKHVYAIDIDPVRLDAARHNAKIYGVSDKITFLCGDFFALAPTLSADVVFLSPPWGGVDYAQDQSVQFDLERSMPVNGVSLYRHARAITENIIYFLPKTAVREHLALLSALGPCECGDIENCLKPLPWPAAAGGQGGVHGPVPPPASSAPAPAAGKASLLQPLAGSHMIVHGYYPSMSSSPSTSSSSPSESSSVSAVPPPPASACGPCESADASLLTDCPHFDPSSGWGAGQCLVPPFIYMWVRRWVLARAEKQGHVSAAQKTDSSQKDSVSFYEEYADFAEHHLMPALSPLLPRSAHQSQAAPPAPPLPSLPNPFLLTASWDPRTSRGASFRARFGASGAEASAWSNAWACLFHAMRAVWFAGVPRQAKGQGEDKGGKGKGKGKRRGKNKTEVDDEEEDDGGDAHDLSKGSKRSRPASSESAGEASSCVFDLPTFLTAVTQTLQDPHPPLLTVHKAVNRVPSKHIEGEAARARLQQYRDHRAAGSDDATQGTADVDRSTPPPSWATLKLAVINSPFLCDLLRTLFDHALAYEMRVRTRAQGWGRCIEPSAAAATVAASASPGSGSDAVSAAVKDVSAPASETADADTTLLVGFETLARSAGARAGKARKLRATAAAGTGESGDAEYRVVTYDDDDGYAYSLPEGSPSPATDGRVYSITIPTSDREPTACAAHTHAPVPAAAQASDGAAEQWGAKGWGWGCDIEAASLNGAVKAVTVYYGVLASGVPLVSLRKE